MRGFRTSRAFWSTAVFCAVAATAAFAADPVPALIAGPKDWTKLPVPPRYAAQGVVEIYIMPDAAGSPFHQNINVLAVPRSDETLAGAVTTMTNSLHYRVSDKTQVTCGRYQGEKLEASERASNGDLLDLHQMIVLTSDREVVATYTRSDAQDAVPDAIAAVDSLCANGIFSGGVALAR